MDLSKITQPRRLDLPHLATIDLNIADEDIADWIDDGTAADRWSDGVTFVRALLAGRATRPNETDEPGKGVPLTPEETSHLSVEQIEDIAEAIFVHAEDYWARADDPAENQGAESASGRLLNAALAWAESIRRRRKKRIETFERATSALPKYASPFSPTMGSLAGILRRENDLSRTFAAMKEADRAFSLLEASRKSTLFGQSLGFDPGSSLNTIGSDVRRFDDLASIQAVSRATSIIESLRARDIVAESAIGIASRLGLASTEAMRAAQRIHEQMEAAPKLTSLSSLTSGRSPSVFDTATRSLLSNPFGDQLQAVKLLNDALRLEMPITQVMRGIDAGSTLGSLASVLARPGYQSIASLALLGDVGAGAAADLLRRYDQSHDDDAELFASVAASITTLDDPHSSDAERADSIEVLVGFLRAIGDFVASPRTQGVATLLTLLFTVHMWNMQREDHDRPDSSPKLVAATTALSQSIEHFEASQSAQERDTHTIRYVRSPVLLRSGPSRDALPIRTVYPDQLVRVVAQRDGWLKAEVYDYRSDAPLLGWIARRNLRISPSN